MVPNYLFLRTALDLSASMEARRSVPRGLSRDTSPSLLGIPVKDVRSAHSPGEIQLTLLIWRAIRLAQSI